jgi:hypothetical protein
MADKKHLSVKLTVGDLCRCCCLFVFFLFPCLFLFNFSKVQKLESGDAAIQMYEHLKDHNPELPDNLRGIIWMAGNTYPELLLSYQDGTYNPETRVVKHAFGSPWAWSTNDNTKGWMEYAGQCASWTFFKAGIQYVEIDETFTFAKLRVRLYGVEAIVWTLNQTDSEGHTFIRGEFDSEGNYIGRYTMKKVIDGNGNKLPAFDEMVETTKNKVPIADIPGIIYMHGQGGRPDPDATTVFKTNTQIVAGDPSALSWIVGFLMLLLFTAMCICCFRSSDIFKANLGEKRQWQAVAQEPLRP